MSYSIASDFIRLHLAGHAKKYASKVPGLLSNPAHQELVVRASLSGIVDELFEVHRHNRKRLELFADELAKQSRAVEMKIQQAAE